MSADPTPVEPVDDEPSVTTWLEYLRWGIPGYGTGVGVAECEPFGNPNFR